MTSLAEQLMAGRPSGDRRDVRFPIRGGWCCGRTDVVEVDPVGRIFVKDQDDDLWHPTEET